MEKITRVKNISINMRHEAGYRGGKMKNFLFIMAVCSCLICGANSEVMSVVSGCPVLPGDNIWNAPVDTLPVDPNSDAYIASIGAAAGLHPDFGSGLWDGGPIGIPFVEVPGTQPLVRVTFGYDDESDPGPYPIPPGAPIEGGPASDGDRHILIIDRDNCILYELFYAFPQSDGSWTAGSGAIFNLNSNALRPAGWTSADAAGLPIFPGLVRYDEVASGEIKHAIRFTAPKTRRAYVWPARHYASSLTDLKYPPMGQRFRLKESFDISGFAPQVQVILTALKKYGMILSDNGSSWFISGAPDERWNNDILRQLKQVAGSNFEAVNVSSLMVDANSGQVNISSIPQAPSNLNSVLNGPDISLVWADNSSNEASFVLERRIDSGAFSVLSQSIPQNTESFLDAGILTNHIYVYRVKARNSFGDSGYSNETVQEVISTIFELTVSSSSGGAVTVPGEGKFSYPANSVVNLEAVPDPGYEFVIWTG
ncbi:MAG: fibronectin type III domain-containing protein, partial [Desulfobacterales bacterium]|nr:fibronectin type III domain-containing protein [Desulfobacterales bacterium]